MEIWTKTSKKEKTFYVIVAFLAFYFVVTNFIIMDRLKSSPIELFDSELIKPKVITPPDPPGDEALSEELKEKFYAEVQEKIKTEANDIRNIIIMKRDEAGEVKATIVFFPGHHVEKKEIMGMVDKVSLAELSLQYASGSDLAFAGFHGHCRSLKYVYECTGPTNYAGHVVAKECNCVLK